MQCNLFPPNPPPPLPANLSIQTAPSLFPAQPSQSSAGAKANKLNLKSPPPPPSSSLLKNLLTPNSSALSDSTSSPSASRPLFSGPLRRPSSSHRLFRADLTKETKWQSTLSLAAGGAVSPWDAAAACALASVVEVSISWARCVGARGVAVLIRDESGVLGAELLPVLRPPFCCSKKKGGGKGNSKYHT